MRQCGGGGAAGGGDVDAKLGRRVGRTVGQFTCPADGGAGKLHRHLRRQSLGLARGGHRLDQVENIGRTRARDRGDGVDLMFAVKLDHLADCLHQAVRESEAVGASMVIATDAGDAAPHHGGRVGHGADDGGSVAKRAFEGGNRGASRDRDEQGCAIAKRLQRRKCRAHHLGFDGDKYHGRGPWQGDVQVDFGGFQPVGRSGLKHPDGRRRHPRRQPSGQQGRAHLAATQKYQSVARYCVQRRSSAFAAG